MSQFLQWIIAVGVIAMVALLAYNVLAGARERHERRARRARHAEHESTPAEHVCRNCMHYDWEEGQAALNQNPVFRRVMESTSPADHSRKIIGYEDVVCLHCQDEIDKDCVICRGTGLVQAPKKSPPSLPTKAKWSDMGACMCPALFDSSGNGTVRYGGDGKDCPHWVWVDDVQLHKIRSKEKEAS